MPQLAEDGEMLCRTPPSRAGVPSPGGWPVPRAAGELWPSQCSALQRGGGTGGGNAGERVAHGPWDPTGDTGFAMTGEAGKGPGSQQVSLPHGSTSS